ncbi:DUF423 domain-containing protein [Pseudomonas sp. F1_0610]|uniref:DUF423 domain-containing protein n=1 Tax=Pseudomonas sp. F1_0610 TaxID=3114284 RepID=UPI0039C3DB5B
MFRIFMASAAFFGLSGVMLGALGSHALKTKLSVAALAAFQTAVQYQLLHAVVLLALAIWSWHKTQKLVVCSGLFFMIGILLFSGSIYCLTLANLGLGIVTPIGGVFFMLGWLMLFISAFQSTAKAAQ